MCRHLIGAFNLIWKDQRKEIKPNLLFFQTFHLLILTTHTHTHIYVELEDGKHILSFYIYIYIQIQISIYRYRYRYRYISRYRYRDTLECEGKWALGNITMNKASGGDGIPAELFQIPKDDAVKVLYSICQQI